MLWQKSKPASSLDWKPTDIYLPFFDIKFRDFHEHLNSRFNYIYILSWVGVSIDGVRKVAGFIDHLSHNSELQVITAPSLISKTHRSPQHPLSLFQPASRSLATVFNLGDSSASRAQVLSSQPPLQNCLFWPILSLAYNISAWTT
jgi:hypothetical protein